MTSLYAESASLDSTPGLTLVSFVPFVLIQRRYKQLKTGEAVRQLLR